MKKPLILALLLLLPSVAGAGEPRWLKVSRSGERSLGLDIAARRYARPDGTGPTIALVGVAHVSDSAYYRALQRYLASHDLVLYESVKPAGAVAPGGETDEARASSTRTALRFVASVVEAFRAATRALPADLAALVEWARARDPRLADFVTAGLTDGWGGEVEYSVAVEEDGAPSFLLRSRSAEGLTVGSRDGVPALAPRGGDSLQKDLAGLLHLAFQLDEIDYGAPNWQPSDMTIDEVREAIRGRGGDPDAALGTLTGTSLSAGLARVALGLLRLGDAISGGALGDTVKAFLIEMLGDESGRRPDGIDEATWRAIIDDRNAAVMRDLERAVRAEPGPRSVAVFYGAGHMPDFEVRLRTELGYEPVEESVLWFRAIRMDLTASRVDAGLLERIRQAVRARR